MLLTTLRFARFNAGILPSILHQEPPFGILLCQLNNTYVDLK